MHAEKFLIAETRASETWSGGCSFCSFQGEISAGSSERQVCQVPCFLLKTAHAISGTEAEWGHASCKVASHQKHAFWRANWRLRLAQWTLLQAAAKEKMHYKVLPQWWYGEQRQNFFSQWHRFLFSLYFSTSPRKLSLQITPFVEILVSLTGFDVGKWSSYQKNPCIVTRHFAKALLYRRLIWCEFRVV